MSLGSPRALRTCMNVRFAVVLFAAVVGAGFFWINYLPQPSRLVWLDRIHALPIFNTRAIRYRDLKILLAGIECDRAGMNVWETCPCGAESLGFKNVPFNYPEAVLWLGRAIPVRLSAGDGDWLGPTLVVGFLLALSFTFNGTTSWQAAYFCALIASPPVLLGIERANYDLVLYCLLFLNISLLDRLSQAASYAVTFGLGMLKLYPIGAVFGIVRRARASRLLFWLTVAAEVLFVILSFNNLRLVAKTTPQTYERSFGYPVIFFILSRRFSALAWVTKIMLPILVSTLVTLAYYARRPRKYWSDIINAGDRKHRSLFISGGAIYCVCFAIGTNFDYRCVFLLFTVPYLLSMLCVSGSQMRVAGLMLVTLFCVFWLGAIEGRASLIFLRAGLTWLLFIFFAYVCFTASLDSLLEKHGTQ